MRRRTKQNPLKKGYSQETISRNIRELMHKYDRTGSIGTSMPRSRKKALSQAQAIAYSKAMRNPFKVESMEPWRLRDIFDGGKGRTKYFDSWEEADKYASSLGAYKMDKVNNPRKPSLRVNPNAQRFMLEAAGRGPRSLKMHPAQRASLEAAGIDPYEYEERQRLAAVDREIRRDRRIGAREAKSIHRLLKGRNGVLDIFKAKPKKKLLDELIKADDFAVKGKSGYNQNQILSYASKARRIYENNPIKQVEYYVPKVISTLKAIDKGSGPGHFNEDKIPDLVYLVKEMESVSKQFPKKNPCSCRGNCMCRGRR